jgi:UDP:flavonoid glycosyltransferase YjiC (YdhE family)
VQRGLTPPPDGGLFEHLYLVPFPRSFRAGQAALPATAREVRPQAPPGAGAAPSWLESVSDAVYVTLGTVFNDPRALAGIVEAVSAIGRPVIATTGAGVDLSPFHEVLARGTAAPVHVAQYLAQDLVLPRCSAVVSHAGSGTFLGAARHGLPQVLIPRGADQQFNARAGAEAGVGLALGPAAREGGHVREAVERVLADPAFRRRSREISAEIAAMPTLDELLSEVEALATTARPAASR